MKLANNIPDDVLEMFTLAGRRVVPGINTETLIAALESYDPKRQTVMSAPPPPSEYITITEYARRMKCCELTISRLIKDGRLEHIRLGRGIRIPATARPQPAKSRKAGAV